MKLLLRTLLLMTLLPLEFALADDEATSNVITYPSRCGIPERTKEENQDLKFLDLLGFTTLFSATARLPR